MNYLAHLYLAGTEEELIVGNFIADSVKGSHYKDYPERVAHGILMHRATDYFSDTHTLYRKTIHRLASKHGKFAGVITDMFYDYLLAINWHNFSGEALNEFSAKTYRTLQKHIRIMPEESKIILEYMSRNDWLTSYKNLEGIKRALLGLSRRMKYYHPMHEAVIELETNSALYLDDFNDFFPHLERYGEQLKNNIGNIPA